MDLHFKPVTKNNRAQALKLQIAPSQKGFVETVAECLKEAKLLRNWHPTAIYDGELMIGFAMYGRFFLEDLPYGRVWLDRLLIDAAYQKRGYGSAALTALVNHLFTKYRCKKLYLSVTPGNLVAAKLYETHEFRFNGEKDIHNEDVMVCTRESYH